MKSHPRVTGPLDGRRAVVRVCVSVRCGVGRDGSELGVRLCDVPCPCACALCVSRLTPAVRVIRVPLCARVSRMCPVYPRVRPGSPRCFYRSFVNPSFFLCASSLDLVASLKWMTCEPCDAPLRGAACTDSRPRSKICCTNTSGGRSSNVGEGAVPDGR